MPRGRPFETGNKLGRGRPAGSRNRASQWQDTLEEDGDAIIKTCLRLAKAGDPPAMKLAIERLIPVRRDRRVEFNLPQIATTSDLSDALDAVLTAVAAGTLTPSEGETIARILEIRRETMETEELEKRLSALEGREPKRPIP
jgi:hypothetical protein